MANRPFAFLQKKMASADASSVEIDIDATQSEIDKAVDEELSTKTNQTSAAGDASVRRRSKKVHRQLSKENVAASGFIHGPRSWKNSRRSRNGFGRGLPKKGGAGGKGVWGLPGSELLETYEDDVNDPNFDDESNGDIELKAIVPEVPYEDIRKKVDPIILEYFENGDTHEAAVGILDCVPKTMRDMFVEQAIEIAMDHKPSHR